MAGDIKIRVSMVDKVSHTAKRVQGRVRRFAGSVKRTLGRLANLRNLAIAGAIAYIGRSFVRAGAKMEMFRAQLSALYDTAEEGQQALDAIRTWAAKTPLETEDVIRAFVKMRAVGMDPTLKQMKAIGGVAVLMDRKLEDVAQGIISMEKEVLQRLGVIVDRTGQQAVITSGNIRKVVEKDFGKMREAVVEVWAEKFPDAMEKASKTFQAKMAIMRSQVFEFQARVAQKFLPVISHYTEALTETVEKTADTAGEAEKNMTRVDLIMNKVLHVVRLIDMALRIIMNSFKFLRFNVATVNLQIQKFINSTYQGINDLVTSLRNMAFTWMQSGNVIANKAGKMILNVTGGIQKSVSNAAAVSQQKTNQMKSDYMDLRDKVGDAFEGMKESWNVYREAIQKGTAPQTAKLPGATGRLGGSSEGEKGVGGKGGADTDAHMVTMAEVSKIKGPGADAGELTRQEILDKKKAAIQKEIEMTQAKIAKIEQDEDAAKERRKQMIENYTDFAVGRMRSMYDTIVSLEMSWAEKMKSIKNQLYRTFTDLIWKMVQGQIKAKTAETVQWIMNERKKQAASLGTAAAEASKGGATGAAHSAKYGGLPAFLIGLGAAVTAIATFMVTANQLVDKQKKYARGTMSAPGGMAWVGERGPELMEVPKGSRINTAAQSRQIAQQPARVEYKPQITIQGNAAREDVDEALARGARDFEAMVRNNYINLNRLGIQTTGGF
jgi:hypothetical protein